MIKLIPEASELERLIKEAQQTNACMLAIVEAMLERHRAYIHLVPTAVPAHVHHVTDATGQTQVQVD